MPRIRGDSTAQPILNPAKKQWGPTKADRDKGFSENVWGLPQNTQSYHAADVRSDRGVGVMLYCKSTHKFLFCLRSAQVDHPNEWALFGGGVDHDETLSKAAVRELYEEADIKLNPKDLRTGLYASGISSFVYYTLLAVCEKPPTPVLNWENDEYKWVSYGRWPTPLHPGVEKMLNNERVDRYLRCIAEVS